MTTTDELNGINLLEIVDTSNSLHSIYVSNAVYENFHRICRFCLGFEDIKPLSGLAYKQTTLRNIIFDCSSLKVDPDDCLPYNLCGACLAELIRCHNFRERCTQADRILRDVYENKNYMESHGIESQIAESHNFDDDLIKDKGIEDILNDDTTTENLSQNAIEDTRIDEVDDNGNCSDSSGTDGDKRESEETKSKSYKCKDCPEKYETKQDLVEHRKKMKHPEARSHMCHICQKSFTRSKLKQHMRVHTKEKPYVCKICAHAFSMSGNLKRHVMIHTGEKPHVCEVCGKGFIQATTLQIHRKTHITDGYDYVDSRTSKAHITCEICGRGFKRVARYKNHLSKHFPNGENQPKASKPAPKDGGAIGEYSCDICKRLYKTKHLLKAHQLTHGEKSYLCSECGKVFTTKAALQSHLKVHTGEKPHTCTVCKRSFAHVGSFEAHMLIHTGKRPYICSICSKSFTQLSHLKYHSRTHSGEKPYTCNYCDKKFALKGNLTVHVRIHTGETPYLCPTCGKGFYDSSSMKKHSKGHGDMFDVTNDVEEIESEEKFQPFETQIVVG